MKRVDFKGLAAHQKVAYVIVKALQVFQIIAAMLTIAALTWVWFPLPMMSEVYHILIVSVGMVVIGCGYVFVVDLIIRPFRAIVLGEDW